MKNFFRNYGLSIAFLVQYLISLVLYGVFLQLHQQHPDSFWYEFLSGKFENLQSEAWQVFWMVVLSAWLIHRGSQQSKDGQEQLKYMIEWLIAHRGGHPEELGR